MAILQETTNNEEVKDEMVKFLRKLVVDILENNVAVVSMNYDIQQHPNMRDLDFTGAWPEPKGFKTSTRISLEIQEL